MAGRKSARNAERVERQEPVHQPIRKSGILSPHEELRERLLETAIDIKENIPERRVTSGSGSTSDGSETRKRRSTKAP
uniref:Uncharacterized protein n=1 Tax=Caenorhabditis japonica TaxID=281687 RepID=A0A8R1I6W8_CAEJA